MWGQSLTKTIATNERANNPLASSKWLSQSDHIGNLTKGQPHLAGISIAINFRREPQPTWFAADRLKVSQSLHVKSWYLTQLNINNTEIFGWTCPGPRSAVEIDSKWTSIALRSFKECADYLATQCLMWSWIESKVSRLVLRFVVLTSSGTRAQWDLHSTRIPNYAFEMPAASANSNPYSPIDGHLL
jgi:hypothetical protein